MKAAEKGHEKVAEQLIALNAELNLQNSVRSTHNFSFQIFDCILFLFLLLFHNSFLVTVYFSVLFMYFVTQTFYASLIYILL